MQDTYGIFRAAQRVASTLGLTLEAREGCQQPYTDGKSVVVPELSGFASAEQVMLWRGYVYHEIGHCAPDVADLWTMMESESIKCNSLFGRILNIVEDIRNERNQHGIYPGRDKALSEIQRYHCAEGAESIGKSGSKLSEDKQLFVDVLSLSYQYRGSTFQPDVAIAAHDFAKHTNLDLSHLHSDIDAMVTAYDALAITRKILDESPDHDAEEEEAKAQKGKGEDGDGESETEGKPGGSSEEGGESVADDISYADLLADDHADEGKMNGGSTKIVYDHDPKHDYHPWTMMRVDRLKDGELNRWHKGEYEDSYKCYKAGEKLSSKVKRLFQSRAQIQKMHNRRTGRLNKRDLYRVPAGDVDVFSQQQSAISPKGTAVMLLTDASGSMLDGKYTMASASAALLVDALSPIGVPTMVSAFTERAATGCHHGVIKDWQERARTESILNRYAQFSLYCYQNADGESIMWAYKQLMSRSEKRKILIVISDGSPLADNRGDCFTYTKEVIKEVSKKVECYGIGLLDDTVKHLYPEYTLVKKVSELEESLLKVIKSKIVV